MDRVEYINSQLSMADVIKYYAPRRIIKGRCACPLHMGDGLNFKIYEKSFYCFRCNRGGDTIKFVSELFGIDYSEAIKKIEIDFNFNIDDLTYIEVLRLKKLQKQTLLEEEQQRERERFSELQKKVLTDFHYCLFKNFILEDVRERIEEYLEQNQSQLIEDSAPDVLRSIMKEVGKCRQIE